jgi:formate dehydrogenase major subunit
MPRLNIDGRDCGVAAATLLLDALREAGAELPHLCHDARLAAYGACRLCVVEIDGSPRPQASCGLLAEDGMVVRTDTPALRELRRENLALIAEHYAADAPAREPTHDFHRLLQEYGIEASGRQAPRFRDDSHPYIAIDMTRCIRCDRCVRICDELQGQSVWRVVGRGEDTHISVRVGATLLDSGCVSCGACVDTCPSGALSDRRCPQAAEQWTRTTCVYCGVGCQLDVGTRAGQVTQMRPADHPVNRGHACAKGRYAWEFATAVDRVTTPMVRAADGWHEVSWDAALDHTAARLRAILDRDGPQALGVLGSARASNEENYLAQKFARVVLGTNNVDCCARVCHTPSAKALKTMLGTGAATNHFDDIEQTRTFLICGANPTENHPVVGARIKQAVRRGARMVVIDPRRIELADYADVHLAVRPGANVPLLNAMAATLIEEGLVDRSFIAARVDGFEELSDFLHDYAPEQVADFCGVAAADIRKAARIYADGPAMCFHGLGVTEHLQGTEGVMCLVNLALLTGNLGRSGAGINPLRGQNNVQGAAHMGCDPVTLTGGQSIAQAGARFAAAWGTPIPPTPGLNLLQMIDAAAGGRLHALWAIGYDIHLTLPNATATAAALGQIELLIVQDLFMNETARAFGTVFLPAASFLERDGTFMNSDRRVQRIRRVVEPPGQARADRWIIQQLAQRMGHGAGFDFADAEAVWNEVRRVWPGGAGLSYRRLEQESLHWPCPHENHPGTPVLHADSFAQAPRARLQAVAQIPSPEQCDDAYPLLLVTGRRLMHFNAGTMTQRTPNALLEPEEWLDITAADALKLQLQAGERVRLRSRYGEAVLPLRIVDTLRPGELFCSFHQPRLFVNRLTSGVRDRLTDAPEYKRTAVRIERLHEAAPLHAQSVAG